ncbi:MAG: DNA-3-methyladenine glycosylase 2 family protein [Gemmatimonadota bacterium]
MPDNLSNRRVGAADGVEVPWVGRQLTNAALGIGTDVLCRRDPDLAAIVRRFGAPPLWGRRPGFQTLVRIILEQQVSLAAARTMYLRLMRRVGQISPASIEQLGISGLRGLGLTGQKAGYCHELAARLGAGELDLPSITRAPDHVGRQILLGIRGIGPWTADIYYLMALRRPDVWPHGDLALASVVASIKGMRSRPDAARLTRLAEQWSPWRSVAARILWHHYLSSRTANAAVAPF